MKRKLLLLAEGNNLNFIRDLIPVMEDYFELRISNVSDSKILEIDYEWSEIIWLEWAAQLSIDISNRKKTKIVILRLHSYEYFCGFYSQINWNNIDELIFVGKNIKDYIVDNTFKSQYSTNVHVIHNSVNTVSFALKTKPPNKKLAVITTLRHCKNIPLLLQCFANLLKFDSCFTLHIAGDYQNWDSPHIQMENTEIKHYISHLVTELKLNDKIFFEGAIGDVNSWLDDKTYIISTSLREGMPVNILEAMSKGLLPVIHNFPGVNQFYPDKYIFNTVEEFTYKIINTKIESLLYRSYIVKNFSHSKIEVIYRDLFKYASNLSLK